VAGLCSAQHLVVGASQVRHDAAGTQLLRWGEQQDLTALCERDDQRLPARPPRLERQLGQQHLRCTQHTHHRRRLAPPRQLGRKAGGQQQRAIGDAHAEVVEESMAPRGSSSGGAGRGRRGVATAARWGACCCCRCCCC
jgi:hypothetical protein